MKKFILFIVILFTSLFLFESNISGKSTSENPYSENHYTLYFDNLNSKNLNKIFKDIYTVIIEIDVEMNNFKKTYRMNIDSYTNLERSLKKEVLNDLYSQNLYEQASYYNINGFKISRIYLRCNYNTLQIIKERSKNV